MTRDGLTGYTLTITEVFAGLLVQWLMAVAQATLFLSCNLDYALLVLAAIGHHLSLYLTKRVRRRVLRNEEGEEYSRDGRHLSNKAKKRVST